MKIFCTLYTLCVLNLASALAQSDLGPFSLIWSIYPETIVEIFDENAPSEWIDFFARRTKQTTRIALNDNKKETVSVNDGLPNAAIVAKAIVVDDEEKELRMLLINHHKLIIPPCEIERKFSLALDKPRLSEELQDKIARALFDCPWNHALDLDNLLLILKSKASSGCKRRALNQLLELIGDKSIDKSDLLDDLEDLLDSKCLDEAMYDEIKYEVDRLKDRLERENSAN